MGALKQIPLILGNPHIYTYVYISYVYISIYLYVGTAVMPIRAHPQSYPNDRKCSLGGGTNLGPSTNASTQALLLPHVYIHIYMYIHTYICIYIYTYIEIAIDTSDLLEWIQIQHPRIRDLVAENEALQRSLAERSGVAPT